MLSSSILDEIKQDLATYQFTTAAQSIPNQPNQQIYVDSLVCPQGFRPCDSVKQRCPVEKATPEIYTNEGLRCYTNVALDKLEAEEQDKPAPDLLTLLTQTERLLDISAQEKPAPPVHVQLEKVDISAQEKPAPPVHVKLEKVDISAQEKPTPPVHVKLEKVDATTTPKKPKPRGRVQRNDAPKKPIRLWTEKKAEKNDTPKNEERVQTATNKLPFTFWTSDEQTEKNDAPKKETKNDAPKTSDEQTKKNDAPTTTRTALQEPMTVVSAEESSDEEIQEMTVVPAEEYEEKEENGFEETKRMDLSDTLNKLRIQGGFNHNLVSIASDMFSLYIRIVDMLKDNDDISWNNIIDVCKALTKTNRHLNPLLDADSIDALSKNVQRAFTS